jgi:hypothetical protein
MTLDPAVHPTAGQRAAWGVAAVAVTLVLLSLLSHIADVQVGDNRSTLLRVPVAVAPADLVVVVIGQRRSR